MGGFALNLHAYIQQQSSMASATVPEPTDGERTQLYRYHLANKFLNP